MSHWIKIEVVTPDKPEIRAAARICGKTMPEAFCAFFRLWAYFDAHTATGFLPGLVLEDLDDIAKLRGFGQAMANVGWISADSSGISISNWDRHNGQSAKKRAMDQKRKQRERARRRWE